MGTKRHGWNPERLYRVRVVDTPRRARPSVAWGREHEIGFPSGNLCDKRGRCCRGRFAPHFDFTQTKLLVQLLAERG